MQEKKMQNCLCTFKVFWRFIVDYYEFVYLLSFWDFIFALYVQITSITMPTLHFISRQKQWPAVAAVFNPIRSFEIRLHDGWRLKSRNRVVMDSKSRCMPITEYIFDIFAYYTIHIFGRI